MSRYVIEIPIHSPGFDKGTLDLLETAIHQADKEFVWKIYKTDSIELTYKDEPSNIAQVEADIRLLDRLQYMKIESDTVKENELVNIEYQASSCKDFSDIVAQYIVGDETPMSYDEYKKAIDQTHILFIRMRFVVKGIKGEWLKIGAL